MLPASISEINTSQDIMRRAELLLLESSFCEHVGAEGFIDYVPSL
jgi:hypothetical protein